MIGAHRSRSASWSVIAESLSFGDNGSFLASKEVSYLTAG